MARDAGFGCGYGRPRHTPQLKMQNSRCGRDHRALTTVGTPIGCSLPPQGSRSSISLTKRSCSPRQRARACSCHDCSLVLSRRGNVLFFFLRMCGNGDDLADAGHSHSPLSPIPRRAQHSGRAGSQSQHAVPCPTLRVHLSSGGLAQPAAVAAAEAVAVVSWVPGRHALQETRAVGVQLGGGGHGQAGIPPSIGQLPVKSLVPAGRRRLFGGTLATAAALVGGSLVSYASSFVLPGGNSICDFLICHTRLNQIRGGCGVIAAAVGFGRGRHGSHADTLCVSLVRPCWLLRVVLQA